MAASKKYRLYNNSYNILGLLNLSFFFLSFFLQINKKYNLNAIE
jgi:hypothetical protein